MISIADGSVNIQMTAECNPSPPGWFGEVVLIISSLRKHGVLNTISEQGRFARRRFGHYEVIDFLAVLLGYALSGERTLETFYEYLEPFAVAFMALFGPDQLVGPPSRRSLLLRTEPHGPFSLAIPYFLLSCPFFPLCPPVSAISGGLGIWF